MRSKAQVHSILDDIEGIGPARRKALMRRFQSMENMKNASVEELAETDSMNLQLHRMYMIPCIPDRLSNL